MKLSIKKSAVLHADRNQPMYDYYLNGKTLTAVESSADLDIIRSANSSNSSQCQSVSNKVARAASAVRRAFKSKRLERPWPDFQQYELPILMYASPTWTPSFKEGH